MKKLILILAIILPMAVLAQKSPVDKLFDKYANQKGFTTVNISGKLLGFAAQIETGDTGKHEYIIAGRSCLAGDVFGKYRFSTPLKIGDTIKIADAAGYTMVKKNWFNGLPMPSIVVRRLDGTMELVRKFDYNDFMHNLS